MAINSSASSIRDMKVTIQRTIKEIQSTQANIRGVMHSSMEWNDEQGQSYYTLMRRIASLTASPVNTLNEAIPKLEKMAQLLEAYSRVKF